MIIKPQMGVNANGTSSSTSVPDVTAFMRGSTTVRFHPSLPRPNPDQLISDPQSAPFR